MYVESGPPFIVSGMVAFPSAARTLRPAYCSNVSAPQPTQSPLPLPLAWHRQLHGRLAILRPRHERAGTAALATQPPRNALHSDVPAAAFKESPQGMRIEHAPGRTSSACRDDCKVPSGRLKQVRRQRTPIAPVVRHISCPRPAARSRRAKVRPRRTPLAVADQGDSPAARQSCD